MLKKKYFPPHNPNLLGGVLTRKKIKVLLEKATSFEKNFKSYKFDKQSIKKRSIDVG